MDFFRKFWLREDDIESPLDYFVILRQQESFTKISVRIFPSVVFANIRRLHLLTVKHDSSRRKQIESMLN